MATVQSTYDLPCGLQLKNRLVKAALAEDLAEKGSRPSKKHTSLYTAWSGAQWGMILTGNVQVDAKHLGTPHDVALGTKLDEKSEADLLDVWKKWASTCQAGATPTLVQINHPGRQSPSIARKGRSLAPSAIPLDLGPSYLAQFMRWIAFGTPKEMTAEDIETVIKQFVDAAVFADKAGFAGVEVHCAHGYLLSQFLSPLSNKRTDGYGGTPRNRARIVKEIIQGIREATSAKFCIGIKINSADFQGYNGLEDSLEQIDEIVASQAADFIEISGGSYENATMMSENTPTDDPSTATEPTKAPQDAAGGLAPTSRTQAREAFFLSYAHQVREKYPSIALMVTGGFRSRTGMNAALQEGGCDLIGVGRPSTVKPTMPRDLILNEEVSDEDAKMVLERVPVPLLVRLTGVKPLSAGLITVYYQKEMRKWI